MECLDANLVQDLMSGSLDDGARTTVMAHLDSCSDCREMLGVVARTASILGDLALAETVAPERTLDSLDTRAGVRAASLTGQSFGRYNVVERLGAGAMGVVYRADDRELGRPVALKLLHRPDTALTERLVREARSMAQVNHPNVVTVFDVGVANGSTYLAMELVAGKNLREWQHGKSARDVSEAYIAAGQGLAAAHAAGIVHRDFKPDNVIVGDDGRPRVTDFGLASAQASSLPSSVGDLALTQEGSVVGTPAYMAPEQFTGGNLDARTDQFSFCVSLYEALYGERPFAADSLAHLIEAVSAGRMREPPARVRVPAWLRKVLLRGLATRREDRFSTMEDLLAVLARDPARQRRRALIGAALAGLLLAGGAFGQRALQRSGAILCRNVGERLAAVWEAPGVDPAGPRPRRDAVRAAFVATGAHHAGDVFDRTATILDGYAKRWIDMYGETCEATHVRGEQSAEVLDLRMDCLNRNRDSLRALTDLFAKADAEIVGKAVAAANALPEVARCADVAVLRAVLPPPRDPQAREQVARLRARSAEARALGDAGRWQQGIAQARPLLDEATQLGYEPVVAEILALLGWLDGMIGGSERSVAESEQAVWAAEATRHDEVAADAAINLVASVGYQLARPEEGERWGRFADAILKRMGPGHERLRAWLANNRGSSRLY